MASPLTENAANANFAVGLSAPDVGVDFTQECNTFRTATLQQLADRSQAVAKLGGVVMAGGVVTSKILVPIAVALRNTGPNFTYVFSSGAHYWQQSSVSGAGAIDFEVPQLPIGSRITGAYCWWANNNNTTLPITTMPALALKKNIYSTGAGSDPGGYDSTVATQADTTAVVATYKLMHKIAITGLTEVVAEDVVYRVGFTGEDGTNATTGGNLAAIYVTLGV